VPRAIYYAGSEERNAVAENAPPGWYQAETDPQGTERYWDGSRWSADTRAAVAPPPVVTGGTGERMTPHGREIASAGSRIGARLIDVIIVGVISAAFVARYVTFDNGQIIYENAFGQWIAAAVGAAYEILFTALKSATPGKMLLGLEIVRKQDGATPLGFPTAALRWVPNVASYIGSGLGFLVYAASLILLFTDRMRRTVFDFVGQTYVVRKVR
jgi:uncharacterized RDD family membrane protein YckC